MTAATRLAGRTVLVADDTAFVRDRFKAAIEAAGHSAVTAQSGQELLAQVRANAARLDLIVLDLRLPHGNGVTLLQAIRKLDHRAAIVIFSGTIATNRRSSPRVSLGIPVAYRFGNTIAAALTINISHGGLAIRTTSPLAIDTAVRVRFRLPAGKNEIDAEGRVSWSDRRLGMGVQFTKIGKTDQAQIDQYVQSHFFSNRKA